MALTAYQTELQNLIQAPSSPNALIPTASQTVYINTARNQIAGDGECIRASAQLTLTSGTQLYAFGSINSGVNPGVSSVIAVRGGILAGQPIDFRPWEWFQQYYLASGATGTPIHAAQQGQGLSGTLWFSPVPNSSGLIASLDTVCLPVSLVTDSTPEAIPYPWTDAVPFYAAWLALMSLQRQADADKMYERYMNLMSRARKEASPSELPDYLPGGAGAQMVTNKTPLGEMTKAR